LIVLKTLAAKHSFWSRLLVLLAVVCFSVSNAVAVPLSDYQSAIKLALSGVESLLDEEEIESDGESEVDFAKTIEEIRSQLPKNMQVELDRGTWNVDNTWLHKALDDLAVAAPEDRSAKLTSVMEWLLALDDRVTELQNAEKVDDHKGAAKQKLESILARPEYESSSQGPSAITRLLREFIRWIQSWLPEGAGPQQGRTSIFSYIVMGIVVVMAALLVAYVGSLLFKRFRRPSAGRKQRKKREARIVLGERLQPEQTSTDLLAEAEALARNGDLRAAIRKGYIALLVELGDRNVISLAQYKTNRDYLRSVSSRPQLHSPLKRLTETFERHWYGFAQTTPNDWQDFRAVYREALQTGN
jgi:hypothetical protein